jgi:hypothetical protein
MLPSARHLDQLVGPIGKFVLDVVYQGVEIAGAANHARRGFAINRALARQRSPARRKDVAGKPVITKARLLTGSVPIAEAHAALVHALSDPTYRKEVVMLTSGLLGARASTASRAATIGTRSSSTSSPAPVLRSFDRSGVRYRIVCNP